MLILLIKVLCYVFFVYGVGYFCQGEVCVGVFQGVGCIFIDFYIVGYIFQFVVVIYIGLFN